MATIDLSTVYKVTAKGKTYYYAWRGKGAPRLKSAPGSPEFVQELSEALASRKTGDKTKLAGLIAAYRSSDDWKDLADKTRVNWSPWLDKIQEHFGRLSIEQFNRPAMTPVIRKWRDAYRATPRSADVALSVFSRLMSFGKSEGLLAYNPVTDIKRLYKADRSEIIWTDEELALLRRHASKEIMWAVELAIYTGMRQSDLLKLSWSHISANAIEMRSGKSRGRRSYLIPMHAALRRTLDAIPKRATTVLTSSDAVPWKTGFGSSWQKTITRAGIDKHFHDLRGTAATKLYLAAFKEREIAAILAWSEAQVDAIITKYVHRDAVLRDMIRRMDENETQTESAKPAEKPSAQN